MADTTRSKDTVLGTVKIRLARLIHKRSGMKILNINRISVFFFFYVVVIDIIIYFLQYLLFRI